MSDPIDVIDYDTVDSVPDALLTGDDESRAAYRIPDDSAAGWALRKLAAAEARIGQVTEHAQAEHERIESWHEQATKRPRDDAAYFRGLLADYARRQRLEGRKNIVLPYGKVSTRTTGGAITADNADEFIEWAEQEGRDDLVTYSAKPALAAIKAAGLVATDEGAVLTPQGEIVPGLKVTPEGVSVTVTPTP